MRFPLPSFPRIQRSLFAVFLTGLVALAGCGGSDFNGSLTGRDGDGTGPKPSAGQAQINALSPAVATAGGQGFTLTATGVNFTSSTNVLWGNTPLTTTYVSTTQLRAVVPASLLQNPDQITITPSPVVTFNFGSVFNVAEAQAVGNKSFTVSKVAVQANDMAWSPVDGRLYLAVSSADSTRPNTLVALDPQTGQFGNAVPVGGSISTLAISADSSYLYAGFDAGFALRRYNLPGLALDFQTPLSTGMNTSYVASDLQAHPTLPHTVAVSRSGAASDVAIFDDNTPRTDTATAATNIPIGNLLWSADGHTLFGQEAPFGSNLYPLSVSSAGVHRTTALTASTSLNNRLHLDATGATLYSDTGYVLDASTAKTVAHFPLNAVQRGFNLGQLMVPDLKLNIGYFFGSTINRTDPGTSLVEAFDLTDFHLIGVASIPNVSGTPYRFLRWGTNGLAVLTRPSNTGGAPGVYLISGAFVTSPAP